MQTETSQLSAPWDRLLDQIEIGSKRFWEQNMLYRDYIRMQNINVWHDLGAMIGRIVQTLVVEPLTPSEKFLLYAATYLYEAGWQRASAPQFSRSKRFEESSRMVHESVTSAGKDVDFGLFGCEPATVAVLAKICTAMGETDHTVLSRQPEQAAGYEGTVRLGYVVALLQLADLLFVRRANRQVLHDLPDLDIADIADARLALQPYITRIDLQSGGLTVHFRIHEDDKELARKMNDLFAEPIRLWWERNWKWLYKDFHFFLILHEPDIEIVEAEESPPLSLKETCEAMQPFLEQFQPSVVELPSRATARSYAPSEDIIEQEKPPEKGVDVGIVIALDEEFAELFNEIKHGYQSFPDGDTGREHYLFERSGAQSSYQYRCVATFVGEMGPMLSSLVTHRLTERWKPRTLIMLGIAAAMSKDACIGDVVVAKQIDSYFDNSKAVPDQDPSKFTFTLGGEVYRSNHALLNATKNFKFKHEKIFQDWQRCCQHELSQLIPQEQYKQLIAQKRLGVQVQTVSGDLASGPTVGAAQAFIDWLKKRNRKYAALEMEAAGFMAAIYEETDAQRTLVLRAISDYGDERKQELDAVEEGAFRRYAMRNAIQLLWRYFEAGILPRAGLLDR